MDLLQLIDVKQFGFLIREASDKREILAKLTEYPFLKVEWRGELRLEGG